MVPWHGYLTNSPTRFLWNWTVMGSPVTNFSIHIYVFQFELKNSWLFITEVLNSMQTMNLSAEYRRAFEAVLFRSYSWKLPMQFFFCILRAEGFPEHMLAMGIGSINVSSVRVLSPYWNMILVGNTQLSLNFRRDMSKSFEVSL